MWSWRPFTTTLETDRGAWLEGLLDELVHEARRRVPEAELRRGRHLAPAARHEALVHAVVLALDGEDLQRLARGGHAAAGGEGAAVLGPADGGAVPLLGETLHVRGAPQVDQLLGRHEVCAEQSRD